MQDGFFLIERGPRERVRVQDGPSQVVAEGAVEEDLRAWWEQHHEDVPAPEVDPEEWGAGVRGLPGGDDDR